jgi:hypothetical protein
MDMTTAGTSAAAARITAVALAAEVPGTVDAGAIGGLRVLPAGLWLKIKEMATAGMAAAAAAAAGCSKLQPLAWPIKQLQLYETLCIPATPCALSFRTKSGGPMPCAAATEEEAMCICGSSSNRALAAFAAKQLASLHNLLMTAAVTARATTHPNKTARSKSCPKPSYSALDTLLMQTHKAQEEINIFVKC